MLHESSVSVSAVDQSGAYKECAQLCIDCPRRTGETTKKTKGIRGWLGEKVTTAWHGSPLKSGVLRSFQTNGRHGVFFGNGFENSGTVTGLRPDTAAKFIEEVVACDGPIDKGNTCKALGVTSFYAICDLSETMEDAIDTLPVEGILYSTAFDEIIPPAIAMQETQVTINLSQPGQ